MKRTEPTCHAAQRHTQRRLLRCQQRCSSPILQRLSRTMMMPPRQRMSLQRLLLQQKRLMHHHLNLHVRRLLRHRSPKRHRHLQLNHQRATLPHPRRINPQTTPVPLKPWEQWEPLLQATNRLLLRLRTTQNPTHRIHLTHLTQNPINQTYLPRHSPHLDHKSHLPLSKPFSSQLRSTAPPPPLPPS